MSTRSYRPVTIFTTNRGPDMMGYTTAGHMFLRGRTAAPLRSSILIVGLYYRALSA